MREAAGQESTGQQFDTVDQVESVGTDVTSSGPNDTPLGRFLCRPQALRTYSKRAAALLSHAIEHEAAEAAPGILFAGFQRLSRLLPEIERYARLAERGTEIHVWGLPDARLPHDLPPRIIVHRLRPDSPWVRTWFVVARGPSFWSALVANETGDKSADDGDRRFYGAWSTERASVDDVVRALGREARIEIDPSLAKAPTQAAILSQAASTERIGQRLLRHLDRIGLEQRTAMIRLQALADENASLLQTEVGLRREAERLVELQRLLSHSAVHDLRGALTLAMGSLELVLSDGSDSLSDRQRALIATAHESGQQTIDLAQTVLDLARLEAGAFPIVAVRLSPARLRDLIEGVVQPRRELGGVIAVRVAADMPDVTIDRRILSRMIANLLENSSKYAPGSPVTIDVTATPTAAQIEVRDHGPGVPALARDVIFQAFQQVETNHLVLGSGLGLAFCRLAAAALGGDIRLENPPDGGARFVVSIPIAK